MNASDIQNLANLARININAENADEVANSISNILHFVDELQSVDTQGILPMAHPLDATQVLRPDVVTEKDERDAFTAIAPETEDGLFLVPKVIE